MLQRGLPLTVEARDRAAKSWPVMPALLTGLALLGAGVILGCVLSARDK